MLNKSNMYDWITGTWNPVGGQCPHVCHYCYVKGFRFPSLKVKYSGSPRLIKHELKKNLGKDKFWFVGSCIDIFAAAIHQEWIEKILNRACVYQHVKFLFQSKNPYRIWLNRAHLPHKSTIGTTIESNQYHPEMGFTPPVSKRAQYLRKMDEAGFETCLTIEPIMDFDLIELASLVNYCNPQWVNIGADSGAHKLPEPPAGKVRELIAELSKFTEVKIKPNLNRILGRKAKGINERDRFNFKTNSGTCEADSEVAGGARERQSAAFRT